MDPHSAGIIDICISQATRALTTKHTKNTKESQGCQCISAPSFVPFAEGPERGRRVSLVVWHYLCRLHHRFRYSLHRVAFGRSGFRQALG